MTQKECDNKIKVGIKNGIDNKIKSCKQTTDNNLFNFVIQTNLRKAIQKSYNEATFIRNLTKELHIINVDAHPLNEIVILHFASIYESILEYVLDKYFKAEIADLLEGKKYAKVDISNGLEIHNKDNKALFLCKEIKEKKKLHRVSFGLKAKRAKDLHIITSDMEVSISYLYNFRNNVHIS